MLDRNAVLNRMDGLLKEYETDGCSIKLNIAMAELLRAINWHNMNALSWNELNYLDGIPVWIQSTDEWLNVYEDCDKVGRWFIPKIHHGMLANTDIPWLWTKDTYGKYWNCYEKTL